MGFLAALLMALRLGSASLARSPTVAQLDARCAVPMSMYSGRVSVWPSTRQDHPLDVSPLAVGRFGPCGIGCGAHASTPPLSIFAPPSKCGRILLSNMVRAEPMAMCMSRYL